MATARARNALVSVAEQVASRCEPHDQVFALSEYKFALILRKVEDPHIYTLVGLCEYSVQSNFKVAEVEAIRHLVDWEWLLSDHGIWCWSDLSTWEKVQKVWSSLEDLYKSERRIQLRRLILKAQFVTQLQNLVKSVHHISSSFAANSRPASAFLRKRWTWICEKWQAADSRLIPLNQQRGSQIRELLRGYKNLDASQEVLEMVQWEQSMWLPISSDWFKWSKGRHGMELFNRYPLLKACTAKRIPLPPLQLFNDLKRQLILSTSAGLETGLRQLQRLAQDYPLKPPALAPKSHSYIFETPAWYRFHFREEYWSDFLRWLAKPSSPTTYYLNSKSNQNSLIIWEVGFRTKKQIKQLHRILDSRFDKHLSCLAPSFDMETLLEQFFVLVYREQFALLWQLVFSFEERKEPAAANFFISTSGTEFARAFYWRFNRSLDKVYQFSRRKHIPAGTESTRAPSWSFSRSLDKARRVVRRERVRPCKTEEQWTKFLGWLAQGSFDPHAVEVPLTESVAWPRPDTNSEESDTSTDLLSVLQCRRWFISTEPSEPMVDEDLSKLVHSEIQRRRLAEWVFAPLFDDMCAVQQGGLECPNFEAASPDNMAVINSPPLSKEWERRLEFWRKVMNYVSASERHMNTLKLSILGGFMQDEETGNPESVYKEIVII
ncbi:HET domain-containing protein [Fusarium sp. LHS14.1]|nr:HET domain-containing protein [Fusarium sp. LHS14.1]